ncbi:MAG: hypothetical protein NTW86_13905 [Candidatus Sumerlaeota bacterium]|nr:hypothetical protein [Candidatus Sumerlaeota bacterium]
MAEPQRISGRLKSFCDPVDNPASTQYAIQIAPAVGGGQWAQADGSVGASAVWRTAAAWGTAKVRGLAGQTTYTFAACARNGAGVETALGPGTSLATAARSAALHWRAYE